jgi:hypothetical protein
MMELVKYLHKVAGQIDKFLVPPDAFRFEGLHDAFDVRW